ncbi:hypothetical protein DSM112329_04797 [Paraconexibacter sp. AEG42_29]|uniref:ATP-grasp enzyme n=1 Tax=Paraconexibacter sp. AEG42_29 TaxID=2997339 RepID=A0AAU7B1T9_9ACTN
MRKTVATLALLTLALPLNLAATLAALLRSLLTNTPDPARATDAKTVLISGGKMTKALQLARSFHAAGHRVVLVETHKYRFTGHRFSRAVDRFRVVPSPGTTGYAEALVRIVGEEGVDVYVPVCSPAASLHDADAKAAIEAAGCEVLHVGPDAVRTLDDKHAFAASAAALGLPVPDTHRITDPQQVVDFDFSGREHSYILKSIAYDPVRRLDLTELPRPTAQETAAFARSLPISEDNPWILQAFIRGQEFCTHATVRDGELRVHCCCESSAFQLNYAMVDKPAIEDWVRRFVAGLNLTGQVSLDFIEAPDGRLYAIECNPRTHSAITMFYDHPGLAAAYLDDDGAAVRPLATSRPTYWLYYELWRLLRHPRTAPTRLRTIARGKDAIFDPRDPLPFLLVHHLQIPRLLAGNLRRRKDWIRVDFNIGKLVEAAGD